MPSNGTGRHGQRLPLRDGAVEWRGNDSGQVLWVDTGQEERVVPTVGVKKKEGVWNGYVPHSRLFMSMATFFLCTLATRQSRPQSNLSVEYV